MDQSILLQIYRGEYAPYRRKDQNSSSYDKLMALQEEILAASPEEKRPLMDSVQDEINTLLMDEGESAFIEGVAFPWSVAMTTALLMLPPPFPRNIPANRENPRLRFPRT